MTRVKSTTLLILFSLFVLMTEQGDAVQGKRTIAVMYFENNSLTDAEEMEPLRKGLADMFITEFSKVSQFQVVERAQLQQLLEEMKLGQSGLLDAGTAQQVGKVLGAQNLLLGSFMKMLDGKMRIDIRIVEVETGLTVKAEEETGKPKDLYKLIARLVAKVLKDLDVKLSRADALKLADVDNKSFKAAIFYARGLEYEDAGDAASAKKMYQKALKENPKFTRARQRLQKLAR